MIGRYLTKSPLCSGAICTVARAAGFSGFLLLATLVGALGSVVSAEPASEAQPAATAHEHRGLVPSEQSSASPAPDDAAKRRPATAAQNATAKNEDRLPEPDARTPPSKPRLSAPDPAKPETATPVPAAVVTGPEVYDINEAPVGGDK